MTARGVILTLALIVAALLGPPARPAQAHALEPGYLEITPIGPDTWRVFWRRPDVGGLPMAMEARLPDICAPTAGPAPENDGLAWVSAWVATCSDDLWGHTVSIDGLEDTNTDVLLRFETPSGAVATERLTPERPQAVLPSETTPWSVIASYLPIGVEHILLGPDHLLFVFALLLLIPNKGRLIGAITAFTIAHSLTMAASTLDLVYLPGPPVEAVIALSIMFLASELAHRDGASTRLSERYPWMVSFSFGLLHGFGFAGALRDIGLPPDDIPLALLSFNLGVEVGQLAFVAAVAGAAAIWARLAPDIWARIYRPRSPAMLALTYAIGGVSAYWFIDRVAGFV